MGGENQKLIWFLGGAVVTFSIVLLIRVILRWLHSGLEVFKSRSYLVITYEDSEDGQLVGQIVEGRKRGPVINLLDARGECHYLEKNGVQTAELEYLLTAYSISSVVLKLPVDNAHVQTILQTCETWGIEVQWVLNHLSRRIGFSYMQHHQASDCRLIIPGTPLSQTDIILKRMTDIVLSAFALIVLSPLFACVMLAINFDDGGPIFFRQKRLGIHRRPFYMCKFRSMCIDAEAKQANLLHLNEMSYPVFKIRDDPRVTRIGRILRRTSLDELPQLWNVLLGQMSLVGPRPPLPSELRGYRPSDLRRLSVKPGMTCLWQVSGRNDLDFEDWMNLDLRYIDNWSYFADIKILFRTIPTVFRQHGAY